MNTQIKEICLKTAEEFWDYLSPQRCENNKPHQFIYRGQREAIWKLLPLVLRHDSPECPTKKIPIGNKVAADTQVFFERRIIQDFVKQCDLVGLSIPNDSRTWRTNHLESVKDDRVLLHPRLWPPEEMFQVMSLAQHHGVPTRLLDWTRRSFVAIYFAASDALKHQAAWSDNDRLAVWKFDIEGINVYENIKTIKVPGSTSSNLAAQAGLFTLVIQHSKRGQIIVPTSLEDEVIKIIKLPSPPLMKITVPVRESKKLVSLCEEYGVTASVLFPDYYGAARAVTDSLNCWERQCT